MVDTARVQIGRVRLKPGVPRAMGNASWSMPYGSSLSSPFAYSADSLTSAELGDWLPMVRGPDTEVNYYRDRRVGRSRDLERNDGWARGGITRVLDNAIGSLFRLIVQPDWRALQRVAPQCDEVWAEEFAEVAASEWRLWADDAARWADAARKLSLVQMFRLQLRHKLIDGDSLAALLWSPETVGEGAARLATTVQMIDPDRLSNPYEAPDTHNMRGGVEINDRGAPIAYHIRRAHQNDMFDADLSMIWDRVERETPWGRPVVVHDHDSDRIAQHRGIGVLTPVLDRMKMLSRYDGAEIAQALLQTSIGTFITSPYDPEQMRMAMESDGGRDELSFYQGLREAAPGVNINGVKIPSLVTGEQVTFAPARHPSVNFEAFEHAMLRGVAASIGCTAEDITNDYSKANYSSLRASMLGAWRTMLRRRSDFSIGTATPIWGAVLEELIDRKMVPMPRRAPSFMAMRAAYMRCRWIGPGRGWVDPVKERQGAVLGMDAGFDTLENVAGEMSGADWRDVLDQRKREVVAFTERGLKLPEWGGTDGVPASEQDRKPQAA